VFLEVIEENLVMPHFDVERVPEHTVEPHMPWQRTRRWTLRMVTGGQGS
jgi:hypothetical protein